MPDLDRSACRAARLVAAALRSGRSSANDAFDRFLPGELRTVSDQYWTPVPVIRQAAVWLRETQVQTVVDIGSGSGKFCVAAALLTRCRFVGLEHRASLVDAARNLAGTFEVDDRVTFVHGELAATSELSGDAFYFFNPFGDYAFESDRFAEPGFTFTPETHRRDIIAVNALLARAPLGTFVITYNGFGGKVPRGYEQIDVATRLPGTLRLWKKQGVAEGRSVP
jgi:SAM-dependent methyltransferase